jgi:diguanylate cyclase
MYEAKRRGKGGFVIHAPDVEGVSLVPAVDAHHAGPTGAVWPVLADSAA